MPEMYEKIRDQYVKKGVDYDTAQSYAAATYNKIRKKHPNMPKLDSGYHAKKIKKS
jgi:hypothetical protein